MTAREMAEKAVKKEVTGKGAGMTYAILALALSHMEASEKSVKLMESTAAMMDESRKTLSEARTA